MIAAQRASRIFSGLPPHGLGQRIGLMGGSFAPAHAAHRQISLLALNRLRLGAIWWLVTPGNPLKAKTGLPEIAVRLHGAAQSAHHPRIVISAIEAKIATTYTMDLIRRLKAGAPATRFVWIMGSDNLRQFHRWNRWRAIADRLPIAVVNRPGALLSALSAPAAQALATRRIDESDAAILADLQPPAWCYLTGPRSTLSSTALRAKQS